MKLGSLFDGIGGALLCARLSCIEPVWASEIEPFPVKVTRHHFPEVKHYGDITQMNGAKIEPVDIIVGGSPCQDLSVAGKRVGLEGKRSGLFMEMIRVIKEMRVATNNEYPRYMVWENVPGAFSSNGGEDFRAVLEETAKIAEETISIPRPPEWRNAGSVLGDDFSISWRTIDAQYWGVPQRRRRIYLVADFGGQSAPEILFESEGLSGHFASGREKGQGIAEDAERCVNSAGFKGNQGSKAGGIGFEAECAPTVLAGQEGHVVCFEPRSQDGVPRISNDGLSPTPNTAQGGQRQTAVCYGIGGYNSEGMKSSNPHSGIYKADTSRTIDQNGGNPACNQGGIAVVANCFDAYQHHNWRECDKFGPLTTGVGRVRGDTPLVAFGESGYGDYVQNRISTVKAAGGVLGGGSETFIAQKQVRRLTPLECERLQGFPDDYTNIPGASDSARYKALGNSFAIPNVYFVISKIKEANND